MAPFNFVLPSVFTMRIANPNQTKKKKRNKSCIMMLMLCEQKGISSISWKLRKAILTANYKIQTQQPLQNIMVNQTTCVYNRSLIVTPFDQQSCLPTMRLKYLFKKKIARIAFDSSVPKMKTMKTSEYPPQQNLPLCTDRDTSYFSV